MTNGSARAGFTNRIGQAGFTYRLHESAFGARMAIAVRVSTPRATTKKEVQLRPPALTRR